MSDIVENQEDDDIILRPDTLACLQEFLKEKAEREQQESALYNSEKTDKENVNFSTFEEDWQLSQFWYSNETKQTLASVCEQLLSSAESQMNIALLSCPSLYESIRKIKVDSTTVTLFEFDRRFSCYGEDFVFFDYNNVTDESECMRDFKQHFDIVVLDPPFLSEECISKMAQMVKTISKPTSKIILCSGETVEHWASTYLGLKKCHFQPQHQRNLGNMFASYANFELDNLIQR